MSDPSANQPVCTETEGSVEMVIEPRARDLGGFSVRRVKDWRLVRQVAFDQGWRAMRDRFYDPNLNNRVWDEPFDRGLATELQRYYGPGGIWWDTEEDGE